MYIKVAHSVSAFCANSKQTPIVTRKASMQSIKGRPKYVRKMNEITKAWRGHGKPTKKIMDWICQDKRSKVRSKDDMELGDMLPKTRTLLSKLYKPFNERLVELLGDKFQYD